jgi:hypothetical protein
MNTPADVRGSRLLAERSSCHVIKRLPSRRRRENNVGCRKKRQGATEGRMGSPEGLKLLGTDPQGLVIQGADWHARCLEKRPNHNEAVEPG